jgi:hypothetical protein
MQSVVRAGGASSRVADNWLRHKRTINAGKLWRKDLTPRLNARKS